MNDLNRITIIGRLTMAPELKYVQSGTALCRISIANNRTYTQDGEKTTQASFFNVIVWGKLGEVISEHCHKGERIGIEGRLQQRSWEDDAGKKRSTVEIVMEGFQFLTDKKDKEVSDGGKESSEQPPPDDGSF